MIGADWDIAGNLFWVLASYLNCELAMLCEDRPNLDWYSSVLKAWYRFGVLFFSIKLDRARVRYSQYSLGSESKLSTSYKSSTDFKNSPGANFSFRTRDKSFSSISTVKSPERIAVSASFTNR